MTRAKRLRELKRIRRIRSEALDCTNEGRLKKLLWDLGYVTESVLNTGYRTNMEITIQGGWSVYVSEFHTIDCVRKAVLETIKLIAKRAIK